jgi:RNA polymerase sigma-70 factor (ECF subfamily)
MPARPTLRDPRLTSDAALMRSDSEEAFAEVVRRHVQVVTRIARSVAGDAADDVVQQTFLSAWLARARFDADRAALPTWLCAIARNRALDLLRAETRHPPARPLDAATHVACHREGPADAASRRETAEELRRALCGSRPSSARR